jgi:hypothetical protein
MFLEQKKNKKKNRVNVNYDEKRFAMFRSLCRKSSSLSLSTSEAWARKQVLLASPISLAISKCSFRRRCLFYCKNISWLTRMSPREHHIFVTISPPNETISSAGIDEAGQLQSEQ